MKATGTRPKITVSADGRGVVGHAVARLLTDVAEVTGLTGGFATALGPLRRRQRGHDPGRVAVDVAVMLADGGAAIADLAVLRDDLFGQVASDPTAWRVLSGMDDDALAGLRAARAAARQVAWAQTHDARGGLPQAMAAGMPIPGLVLDIDASIVICHSEKQDATRTWKMTFGITRCSASWTTPAKPWPGCCARAGPGRTPPSATSRSSTRPWNRSRTRSGTAPQC